MIKNFEVTLNHSHSKRKDSMETWDKLAILCIYVENQAILEPIPLNRVSKCKKTKEQDCEDFLWKYIFIFLCEYCQFLFLSAVKNQGKQDNTPYNRFQFVKETQSSTAVNTKGRAKFTKFFARSYLYKNLGADIQIL